MGYLQLINLVEVAYDQRSCVRNVELFMLKTV